MNWRAWLYAILWFGVGGAATSMLAAFSMPDVFNFTHQGWIHLGKLAFSGGIVPVLGYLSKSPLPGPPPPTSVTVTQTQTKSVEITPK